MVFGWGIRGFLKILDEGYFECPLCNMSSTYELKSVQKRFAIFWIPIIPLGKFVNYLECQQCDGVFDPRPFYNVDGQNEEE